MKVENIVTTLVILLGTLTHSTDSRNGNQKSDSPELGGKRTYSDFRNLKLHESHHKSEKTSQTNKVDDDDDDDAAEGAEKGEKHSERLLWLTDDGRLALPPGAVLTITPTLGLPFVRYPPDGFFSNISISLPLTIDFDKLGLTDNQNPLGTLPFVMARQAGRMTGSLLANYVSTYLTSRNKGRRKRQAVNEEKSEFFRVSSNSVEDENVPKLPETHQHAFHGGERALVYAALEDFLHTFGMDGKACLLRTICEIHSMSIEHLGLVGEMMKLFLTASKSPFSQLIDEYVQAEKIGKGELEPGECFPYYKECSKSLFRVEYNKYRRKSPDDDQSENIPSM